MRKVGLVTLLSIAAALPLAAGELTQDEFTRLHKELRPAKDEPYLSIPWKISLLDAQKAAIKENKPIFIWAMDGHPLGCT
jgi:hypothetical protein